MTAMIAHDGRRVPVLAFATEGEVDAFERVCQRSDADIDVELAPATSIQHPSPGFVLLVGRGRADDALRWNEASQHAHSIALMVAFDETVIQLPALLGRCSAVLLSPFSNSVLESYLTNVFGKDDEESETANLLRQNVIGESPQVRRLLRLIVAFACHDTSVLLSGETGTGKEIVARGIHYASPRRDHAFVPVNCCALTDDLLVAELFGYEKGAFTDAKQAYPGLVAQANSGTLFLDEVDSLSPKGQGALLRFLEDQEYRPLGSESVYRSNVRVVSATNRDLATMVQQSLFREDLYYRLHVLSIELPALRDREGDIPILAEHFLHELACRYDSEEKFLHPLTLRWMETDRWPGNVRELENYLHRAFVLTPGASILAPQVKGDPVPVIGDSPQARLPAPTGTFQEAKARVLAEFESEYLREILRSAGGNVSDAARRAGKERRAFGRLLKKHGIDRRAYSKR